MEYFKIEGPVTDSDKLADAHNALLCAVIANSVGAARASIVSAIAALGGKRHRARVKKYKPQDFILIKPPKRKKTSAEMLQLVEILNAAFGGVDLRKKKG